MDWIDSQCHFLDETYRGIVAVDPKIGVDILWDYSKPSTRICRLPFGYGFNDFQHSFGPQTLPSLAINQVVNVCAATTTVSGNTYVTSITVEYLPIIFNPDGRIETGTPFCVTNPVNCCTDPSVSTCAQCITAPTYWKCTIAGVSTDSTVSCDDCGNLNGTFVLTYAGTGCTWNGPTLTACGESDGIVLAYSSGAWTITGPALGTLTLVGSFNCNGTNTFTLGTASTLCTGTITAVITPV